MTMCEDGHAKVWTPTGWLDDQETIPRGLYRVENLAEGDYTLDREMEFIGTTQEPAKIARAILAGKPPNLIGSKVHVYNRSPVIEYHAPLIDLDFPTRYKRSSTPDHHHLLLDTYITDREHKKLMRALREAGIVEAGFESQIKRFGQTFVRWNTTKQEEQ